MTGVPRMRRGSERQEMSRIPHDWAMAMMQWGRGAFYLASMVAKVATGKRGVGENLVLQRKAHNKFLTTGAAEASLTAFAGR